MREVSAGRLAVALVFFGLQGCDLREEAPPPSSPALREALGAPTPRVGRGTVPGLAAVEPQVFEAGEETELVLRLNIGSEGIATGGSALIDLPKSWFILPNQLAKPVQTENPTAPHFIGATSSRPEAELRLKLDRENLDGQIDLFPHLVEVLVTGEPLREGDRVEVSFASTTAPFLTGAGRIRVAVDSVGYREYRLIETPAGFTVHTTPPAELRLIAPSQAVVGEEIELGLIALDRYANPVPGLAGSLTLHGLAPEPIHLDLPSNAAEPWQVKWTATRAGFTWPTAILSLDPVDPDPALPLELRASGNPIRIFEQTPASSLFWGDLASHSSLSSDGAGSGAFEYARNVARLDFFAPTEHSESPHYPLNGPSLTAAEWNGLRERVETFYHPGRFVPLLGYEVGLPQGHRNVYFLSDLGVPWGRAHLEEEPDEIWRRSVAGEVIAHLPHPGLQHHRRIARVVGPRFRDIRYRHQGSLLGKLADWSLPVFEPFERAVEIYSAAGSFESGDPTDLLSPARLQFQPAASPTGRHFVRDAWESGHRLGVVAASDNHFAQPGRDSWGLTAVEATGLTREEIFRSLGERRTWASTGERFYADFELQGMGVGQVAKANLEVSGRVTVAGRRDLSYVEVARLDTCTSTWTTAQRWDNPGKLLEASFTDSIEACELLYYLRAELTGLTGDRPARLWSSPVWVLPGELEGHSN